MKFQYTTLFWLLLNASASSFATHSNNYRSSSSVQSTTKTITRLPFAYRGGASSASKLSASVESALKATVVSPENLDLLSERGRKTILSLVENDVNGSQSHVYGDWPEAGTQDQDKKRLAEQVRLGDTTHLRQKSHSILILLRPFLIILAGRFGWFVSWWSSCVPFQSSNLVERKC
jgi:hypothetical protein